jgi:hypothetical protein
MLGVSPPLQTRIHDYLGGSFSQVVWVSNCAENRFAMRANNYKARHRRAITNQVVSQLNRDYPLACWAFPAAHRQSPSPARPSPQILVTQYRRQEQLTFGNRDKSRALLASFIRSQSRRRRTATPKWFG